GDAHESEDAFQATFLVLVEKAGGLWVEETLGPWLHRVAVHTSSCAGSAAARRRNHELRAAERAVRVESPDAGSRAAVARVLHAEIDRLPDRYRVPIVLCDLEGKSCEEAARQMGRPVGTVKSWRARGRAQLRARLVRAGLAPALGAWAAGASEIGRAAV